MAGARKTRILIVDDHAETRAALKTLLREEFDIVGELPSAESLQDAVRKHKPDVLLLDISMPKINGLTAARNLRKAGTDLKIIFVTEQADPQYIKEAFRAGGSGFVLKSRAPAQIRSAIYRVLDGGQFPSEHELASGDDASVYRS